MVERNNGPNMAHEEKIRRHLQVLYARETRQKQIFMEELKEYRKHKAKQMLHSVVVAIGPKWYQALSVQQRTALDTLERSIYQDLLEGRPKRSSFIMYKLGLVPRPSNSELMNCIYLGRHDPKQMLAQLYLATYGHPIEGKRASYCLNARLILSAILYLGLDNLIQMLQKTFAPDASITEPEPKPKRKPKAPVPSPYLTTMVAKLYVPRRIRRVPPLPLPDLTELNKPYEEEPVIPKPPPPPPPPPPPKKRLPRSYCDKLAGIITITAEAPVTDIPIMKKTIKTPNRKSRNSKTSLLNSGTKKKYGLNLGQTRHKTLRRRKPVTPMTGLPNTQYTINGVAQFHGKTLYVLGNVSVLPAQGDLIHGGFAMVNGEFITIHCGFRGRPPAPKADPCDCVKKWQDTVFQYVKENKCYCGHYYDFHNEGNFPPEELPYFTKPSRNSPLKFDYHTIFDLDSKRLHIQKEFNKIWDTDSVLHVDDGTNIVSYDKKKKKKKSSDKDLKKVTETDNELQVDNDTSKAKKKKLSRLDDIKETKKIADTDKDDKKKRKLSKLDTKGESKALEDTESVRKMKKKKKLSGPNIKRTSKKVSDTDTADDDTRELKKNKMPQVSNTCLGMHPKPQDYLKCALRSMRHMNIAARLPDLHLVPELKEWMRRRLYGKLTVEEKKEFLRKSTTYWRMFTALGEKGFGHVQPPKEPMYTGHTTWTHKQTLNDTFRHYTHRYKLSMFRSHAYVTNLLWRTMYQAEFPDKNFREIYFSYLFGQLEDIQLIHPYSMKESLERKIIMATNRYVCLPAGYEPRS